MAKGILAASLAAICATGFIDAPASAQSERVFPVAERPVLADQYPQQIQSWPGGVTSVSDVTYSTITGYRPLAIDIYMPPRGTAPKPLILHIHGGGWTAGHTRHAGATSNFPAVLASLAAEGFVVASVEYRLAQEAPYPAQLQDVRAALRFLKSNAANYGIDATRSAVWGGSAGGHLAALVALTCGNSEFDVPGNEYALGSECVQAAATWYGIFDFASLAAGRPDGSDGAASLLLRCEGPCSPEALASASPVTFIDPRDPPFLLIHGDNDSVVPVSQSHEAEARMRAAGVPVESIYIPGVNHSFIGASLEVTRAATLQSLNATFDFFHAQLDGAGE